MNDVVNMIFAQKLNEIQSRVPVRIFKERKAAGSLSFGQILNQEKSKSEGQGELIAGANSVKTHITENYGYPVKFGNSVKSGNKSNSRSKYSSIVSEAAKRYAISSSLINAVIKAESGFNPDAVSSAGAMGLMQLMPATARSLGVTDPFDPEQNIVGGTRYLRQMLDRYNGDVKLALAAYNCGWGTLSRLGITNLDDPAQMARLPSETRNYVNKIMGYLSSGI